MGTRRSRHNKGRKPIYKEHRLTAREIIDRPAYVGGLLLNARLNWSDDDCSKLSTLAKEAAPHDGTSSSLGRPLKSIVNKARELHLPVPKEWLVEAGLSNGRPRGRPAGLVTEKRSPLLAYPYIMKPREEHASVMEVNTLIPKTIPDHMRADMCQEILLALLEGRTTMNELRFRSKGSMSATYFMRKFYKDNYEMSGYAAQLEGLDDPRTYDEIASSIAAKDWHLKQFADETSYVDAWQSRTRPTQLQDVWRSQVNEVAGRLSAQGIDYSYSDVEELMDAISD